MTELAADLKKIDPIWKKIVQEGEALVSKEPSMGGMTHASILQHDSFEKALAYRISMKLETTEMPGAMIAEIAEEAIRDDANIGFSARADVTAVMDRDPASHQFIQPFLFFKGYQALQAYRIANWLWKQDRKLLSYYFQMKISEAFGVDIHPAATLGKGIMIDHAHSIVIGETAVVGDNVSMLHSVTLGGTGKKDGDRHPKIHDGVLIGAGAKVLGDITVGKCSRIASGSVVLKSIPPCKTVAGVPAKIVGEAGCSQPSQSMNQLLS